MSDIRNEKLEFPRDLHVDESKHVKYKDLADYEIFKTKDAPMKEVFLYAMAIGYHNNVSIPLSKKKGSIPSRLLLEEEEWLIKSLAIAKEKNLEVLFDIGKVIQIAEENANGGIDILYDTIIGPYHGDPEKRLDQMAREIMEQSLEISKEPQPLISEPNPPTNNLSIQDLIQKGESNTLEFKSSLRWDYKQNVQNRALELMVAKALVAFLNSEGGILIIGVDDQKEILSLEKDFSTLKKQNEDGFELKITEIVNMYIGKQFRQYMQVRFEKISEKIICAIDIDMSDRPAYLTYEGKMEFYIRLGNSSQPLNIREANEYIREHWKS